MGLPSDLFTSTPDENLLCCICHDVLEEPASCRCGHTFCKGCASGYFASLMADGQASALTCPARVAAIGAGNQ